MTNDHPQQPHRTGTEPPSLTGSPFDSDTFTSATFVTVGRGPYLALASVWLLTRVGMVLLLLRDSLGIGGVGREVDLYRYWYSQFAQGTFPPGDATWQYPPGAGLVIMSPGLLPWLTYFQAFVVLTLLADATVTAALGRADSARLTHGAWVWVCGLPLLLHLPLARYDVQTTALAVLALLALNARSTASHRLGGALAGIGAMVKVWPVLALIGTPAAEPAATPGPPPPSPRSPSSPRSRSSSPSPSASSGNRAVAASRSSPSAVRPSDSRTPPASGRARSISATGPSSTSARTSPPSATSPCCSPSSPSAGCSCGASGPTAGPPPPRSTRPSPPSCCSPPPAE